MDSLIKVENLSVIYNLGKSNEFTALAENNLSIYPGEYIIIFGPSGCGKSTLLYAIAGLQKATSGRVRVGDAWMADLSKKALVRFHQERVGMIFQAYYLISTLSVLDNVCLPQIFTGISPKERT